MKTLHTLGLALACTLASCSGVSNFDLTFRGQEQMNPNSEGDPNQVEVRVMRLLGDGAASAFASADWSKLWEDPKSVSGLSVDGDVLSKLLDPIADPAAVLRVPHVDPKVSAFGIVALFNKMPPKGQDRVLLPRATAESVEIWLHDSHIETAKPSGRARKPAATKKDANP